VIPALLAAGLGATAILAYFVCGLLIFMIGLCFAELGSKTSRSGGAYTYIETAFGPYPGFLANNIYWLGGSVLSDAAVATALAEILKHFFPFLGVEVYRILFLIMVFGGLTLLNIRGAKNGVRFIEFAALTKLIPLIVVVIAGIAFIKPGNLAWEIAPTVNNIGTASLLLFFAFLGLEGPLSNGGEIKNPKRTVPWGVFLGVSCVLILYIAIQLVTQGVLGSSMSSSKEGPLSSVAGIAFGQTGMILIVVVTAVSMVGFLGGEILSIPRILFAGAKDGLMPKPLARIHLRFFTPHVAIVVYASLGCLFAIFGGFEKLATIASASILIIYLGGVLAVIQLRRKENVSRDTFRAPGGIVLPLVAAAGIVWLLSNLSKGELIGIAIFIVVFSIIYFILKFIKKKNIALENQVL
jgi:amino acid transporter